jgi:superfamily I DNA and/or RNA helicase
LIVGPYGCGKTSVIGTIVSNLLSSSDQSKVLAVAPSNAATDNLTEALVRDGLKVLRIVAKSHEAKIDSCMPISQHCLHSKLKLVSYAEGLTPSEKNKKETEESIKLVEEADVILTTCASARMDVVKSVGKFSAVIMDESCQVENKF